MNTAIDTCESIEKIGVEESDRSVFVNDSITINDYLISSWVAPENLSKKVICKSHELGVAKPYTDELSRTILTIGSLCSELVKLENTESKTNEIESQRETSIKDEIEALCNWYENYCLPSIENAMKKKT